MPSEQGRFINQRRMRASPSERERTSRCGTVLSANATPFSPSNGAACSRNWGYKAGVGSRVCGKAAMSAVDVMEAQLTITGDEHIKSETMLMHGNPKTQVQKWNNMIEAREKQLSLIVFNAISQLTAEGYSTEAKAIQSAVGDIPALNAMFAEVHTDIDNQAMIQSGDPENQADFVQRCNIGIGSSTMQALPTVPEIMVTNTKVIYSQKTDVSGPRFENAMLVKKLNPGSQIMKDANIDSMIVQFDGADDLKPGVVYGGTVTLAANEKYWAMLFSKSVGTAEVMLLADDKYATKDMQWNVEEIKLTAIFSIPTTSDTHGRMMEPGLEATEVGFSYHSDRTIPFDLTKTPKLLNEKIMLDLKKFKTITSELTGNFKEFLGNGDVASGMCETFKNLQAQLYN